MDRAFQAADPNEIRLTDITEFQLPAGKASFSPMIDCFDGLVVSWSVGTRPNAELVNIMLEAAIETITDSHDRSIVHSTEELITAGPDGSRECITANSHGQCHAKDNAVCEGFFGRLKNEMYYHSSWIDTTLEDLIQQVDTYICWYNQDRIKVSLGGLSPLEYRQHLGITAA